jgi:hypothetical protein
MYKEDLQNDWVDEDLGLIERMSEKQLKIFEIITISLSPLLSAYISNTQMEVDNLMALIFISILTALLMTLFWINYEFKIKLRKISKDPLLKEFHVPDLVFEKFSGMHEIENKKGDTLTKETWVVKSKGEPISKIPWFIDVVDNNKYKIIKHKGFSFERNKDYDKLGGGLKSVGYDLKFEKTLGKNMRTLYFEYRRYKHYPPNYETFEPIRMIHKTKYSEFIVEVPENFEIESVSATHEDLRKEMDEKYFDKEDSKFKWHLKNPKELNTYRVIFKWTKLKKQKGLK